MGRRWIAAALLLAVGCLSTPACRGSEPSGAAARLDLTLARGWSVTPDPKPPWVAPARTAAVHLETTVTIPADRVGPGSVLVLRDTSWSAQVTVNGTALPAQTGGLAPIEVPVGPYLKAGANQLVVRISGPRGVSPLLSGQDSARARLGEPPVLSLRPAAYVDDAWVTLDDGAATASARVDSAPAGSVVHFSAMLDGRVLQTLGQAKVVDGQATAAAAPWKGPVWSLGLAQGPALFQLQATLAGPDGALLDRHTTRTGLRDFGVEDRALALNGQTLRLLGQRVTQDTTLTAIARLTAAAGHNVVEYHGRLPSPADLAQADERGLPVVVLPRCPGILNWRGLSAQARDPGPCVAPDAALVQSLSGHPSLVLWILEEGPGGPNQAREGLLTDPLARPIVGHHLPGQALVVDGPGSGRDPSMFAGHWITEMGSRREHAADPRALPMRLLATLKAGAVGGIVHGPARGRAQGWAQVWQELLVDKGVSPWIPGTHRAESRVTVSGLTRGQVAWIEAPGHPPVGATADRNGVARLALWHQGTVTLHVGDLTQTLQVAPGTWSDTGWTGEATQASVP